MFKRSMVSEIGFSELPPISETTGFYYGLGWIVTITRGVRWSKKRARSLVYEPWWRSCQKLRDRMIEEMKLGNFSAATQESYVYAVRRLARYHKKSPDQLSKEDIRVFLVHLTVERKLSPNSLTGYCSGLQLYDPTNPASVLDVKEVLPVAARALGLTVRSWEVRAADSFERVFAALNKERPDGLYVLGGPLMRANRKRFLGFALKSRLPSVYISRESVEAGGLTSYGADNADSYRRVAYYVDRILKGAKPGDLPVEQPTKFELVINLKTAKQIGVTIPPELLARANRLIK
jgi:hypothetical protein